MGIGPTIQEAGL